MPIKKYGIYLAYPPMMDLGAQGLGRYLGEFLKAADQRRDVRFVVACPSWMVSSLLRLLETANIQSHNFEIICPDKEPLLLRVHELLVAFRGRPRRRHLRGFLTRVRMFRSRLIATAERQIAGTRSIAWAILLGVVLIPIGTLGLLLFKLTMLILGSIRLLVQRASSSIVGLSAIKKYRTRLDEAVSQPKEEPRITRLYRLMLEVESSLMRELIEGRRDVVAWYCPTAFWPQFHQIRAPRLMCVPDVVIADFPVGFANVGGAGDLDHFRRVEMAIDKGAHFVAYSEDVKWRTLVKRYQVDPLAIRVVRHGANRLDELVLASGSPDNDAATSALCKNLFDIALSKALKNSYATFFKRSGARFIFYPSQFRPNKNVISLLRAYEYLLRRRFAGHKLVLTGDPTKSPDIARFVEQHNLENDVLCLHGLSDQELAACYRLADLAVNPSLSEGGFPFTFTEALSVGTPVVMGRIPATEEVITDIALQDLMLFDPFDWTDVANRIEWGLNHRKELLDLQTPVYQKLAQRTWRDVVDDHIDILDRISEAPSDIVSVDA